MLDKHEFIRGNPLLNRERVANLLITAIITTLEKEGVTSRKDVCLRTGCTKKHARFIYLRSTKSLGIKTLLRYCDALSIKLTMNELFGTVPFRSM